MPKSTSYTVIWIETSGKAPALDYETFIDRASLEARVINFTAQSIPFTVVTGSILDVTIDTSPRVSIGAAAVADKKPRAPRSDKGSRRKKVVEVEPKALNGGAA
jgi:hypothetical protein